MKARQDNLVDREVGLLLITGRNVQISAHAIWQLFFRKDSMIFFCAAFAVVTFLYPVASDFKILWWMKLSAFGFYFLMIPVVYFLQVLFIALVTTRRPHLVVFEPFMLLVTATVIEVVDHTLSPLVFGEEWRRWIDSVSFGEQVAGNFVFMFAIDILFCYFVLPLLRPDRQVKALHTADGSFIQISSGTSVAIGAETHLEPDASSSAYQHIAPDTPEENDKGVGVLEIGGTEVISPAILAVEAEEHYVRIWTEDREIYTRHSFGGLIANMNDSDGFTPRRGVWFSFRNIQSIRRDDSGKYVITPFKGPTAVVPKARAREVSQLLRARKFPAS